MKTVYAVTDGEYSDYSVRGIFSTKEKAELYAKAFRGDVNEWPVDPVVGMIKPNHKPFIISMDKSGVTIYINDRPNDWSFASTTNVMFIGGKDQLLEVACFAKDQAHAIKITNDLRARILKQNRWGQPYEK